jgi:hypothetical protein
VHQQTFQVVSVSLFYLQGKDCQGLWWSAFVLHRDQMPRGYARISNTKPVRVSDFTYYSGGAVRSTTLGIANQSAIALVRAPMA